MISLLSSWPMMGMPEEQKGGQRRSALMSARTSLRGGCLLSCALWTQSDAADDVMNEVEHVRGQQREGLQQLQPRHHAAVSALSLSQSLCSTQQAQLQPTMMSIMSHTTAQHRQHSTGQLAAQSQPQH